MRVQLKASGAPSLPPRLPVIQKTQAETVTSGRTKRTLKERTFGGDFVEYSGAKSARYDEAFSDEEEDEEIGSVEEPDTYVPDPQDELPGDFTLPGQNEPWPYRRPGWKAGTYTGLAAAQTKQGVLECGLCKKAIALVNGKESWQSKNGTKKLTRPPIDHFNPDWVKRLADLKVKIGLLQKRPPDKEIRAMVVDEFHAPDLRVTHLLCNSGRPKSFS